MFVCTYTYCRTSFGDKLTHCPVCGYPADGAVPEDAESALRASPKLPVARIIDMHQIIPNPEGMVGLQVRMMEGLGIERALLQSVPTKVSSISGNRQLLAIRDAHPDRFIISHFMDPRHPRACKRLRQYRERGVRVIKLLPCLGYQPDASRWHRFWRTMEALGQVAMIHTGFITARHKEEERRAGVFLNSKHGRPIYFDLPARRYPGIPFILCHMGGAAWVYEAAEMVNQHKNVWGDFSGSGAGALRRIAREGIALDWTKAFWGNDASPLAYPYNLNLLLHHLKEGGVETFTSGLLYDNAKRFISDYLS